MITLFKNFMLGMAFFSYEKNISLYKCQETVTCFIDKLAIFFGALAFFTTLFASYGIAYNAMNSFSITMFIGALALFGSILYFPVKILKNI